MNASFDRYTGASEQHRAAADRICDGRPVRLENEPERHCRPGLGLGLSFAPAARGNEDGRTGRDGNRRSGRRLSPEPRDRRRGRRRERSEDDGDRALDPRRRRAPVSREERDPVRPGSLVQEVQGASLPGATPAARNRTLRTSSRPSSVIPALDRDEFGGWRAHRRGGGSARTSVREREVVPVHAHGRRLGRLATLHGRALPEHDGVVRARTKPIGATGLGPRTMEVTDQRGVNWTPVS